MRAASPFTVLSIGGSDPLCGAGIQGDLATFAAHGVLGTTVVAAVTAQNHAGVTAVAEVTADLVAAQLEAVFGQVTPRAVKTGMLWSPETVETVARALRGKALPLVVDPVLAASAGGALARSGLAAALAHALLPLATLATPNLDEAAIFLGRPVGPADAAEAAAVLRRLWGCRGVLVKGGHAGGDRAIDVLATEAGTVTFSLPRVATGDGHGSGCALSASLAVRLGRGDDLSTAVAGAKAYLHRALAAARPLGRGRGPVRHDVAADAEDPVVEVASTPARHGPGAPPDLRG